VSAAISLLVADDHAVVRAGLVSLLREQPGIEVVGEAENGVDCVRLAERLRPDVVLMDLAMPVLNGIEATREIVRGTSARVLMLTGYDTDEYVYQAIRAGASGYLLKDSPATELAHAVRVIAAGEALLAPSVTRRLIEQFAAGAAAVPIQGRTLDRLTEREREVLTTVARGLSNAEIAAALVIAEQTVKTHVSRILTKLGLRDRAQLVVAAYESGLVRPGQQA